MDPSIPTALVPPLRIEVVFSPAPRQVRSVVLELPSGSSLADAVRASGLLDADMPSGLCWGVWGRVQAPEWRLRSGDRVEIYRPLTVDPKEARRQRYRRQGRR